LKEGKIMRTKKKIWCLLIVLAMMLTMIAACNNDTGSPESTPAATTQDSGSTATDDTSEDSNVESETTLTMFVNASWARTEMWGRDKVSLAIIEETGVNLELDKASTDDDSQIQMMIASGTLPDMYVIGNVHSPLNYQLEEPSISADIGKLIDQHAPWFREYMTDQWFEITKGLDGINYSFSNCVYTDQIFLDGRYAIVGPWNPATLVQDELYNIMGRPAVSTPADLMETLIRVRDEYPDMTPIFFNGDISSFKFMDVPGGIGLILSMFGVDKYYYNNDNYYANFRQPEFLTGLLYLNEMSRNGLITEQTFAISSEEANTIREQGNYFFWTASVSNGGYVPVGNTDVSYEFVPYFDTATIYHMSGSGWAAWYLNANMDEDNLKTATEFATWMLGKEGNIYTQWGFEGEDWEYDEAGRPMRTENYDLMRATNWTEYSRDQGVDAYWWNINYWDHMIVANTIERDGIQRVAWEMYKDYSGATSYYYRFDPMSHTDEGIALTRVNDLFIEYFPRIVLAATAGESEALYNEFIGKAEDAGIGSVEDHWNQRWAETKYIFGN